MTIQSSMGDAQTTEEAVHALLEAARYDDLEDLISLASQGLPLNLKDPQGRTALHMAAANGHLGVVEHLIQNRVDVNVCNVDKNTPLHWACLNGHCEVVRLLISAGADATILNCHERTPMDEAISQGNLKVVDAINEACAQRELDGVRVH